MEFDFTHNNAERRFELIIDDKYTAFIGYEVHNGKMYLNHTLVPEELSGQGIGKILASKVFALIQVENIRAVATCSYLVALVTRNPEWSFIEV